MGNFTEAAYFEGHEHIIDVSKFDPLTGIYSGADPHALVWPLTEEERSEKLEEGPWVMFAGHSFTGLWDSAYYYLRELARMAGIRLHVAYSYWGGTGIGYYAGLVPGCEDRAAQADKVLAANDHYDYCIFAGNSDEAVMTVSGEPGATDYSQRDRMLKGARILMDKASKKGAKTIFWVPHAYKYGFFYDMMVKPREYGRPGDKVEIDGKTYTYTLDNEQYTNANMAWYREMTGILGKGCMMAPVALAYRKVITDYADIIDPFLPYADEPGFDLGHQNNIGNYISACVLYSVIFNKSPEGLGIPVSHSFGYGGGRVNEQQAAIIQKEAWAAVKSLG